MLGPSKGYPDILDEHLSKKSEEESKKQSEYNPIRPSAAGKCAHELAGEYAQFKGLLPLNREVLKPELQRIFGLGHAIEYMEIKSFRESGLFKVKYTQQVVDICRFSDGTLIEGSLDKVLFFETPDQKFKAVCDWKSKKDRHSSFGATGWDEADEGYAKMRSVNRVTSTLFYIDNLEAFLNELNDPWLPANFLQLNLYANSQFLKDRGIDHASLFYFNKNDCRLREMRFRPSEVIFEQTKQKFNLVHDTVTAATSATIKAAVESLKCRPSSNCRYCWPDEAKRAYFATLKPKVWPKDTNRLPNGNVLEKLFAEYEEGLSIQEATANVEAEISKIMIDIEEDKIRLANGNVYENKFLKSPKPHHEIRRSK